MLYARTPRFDWKQQGHPPYLGFLGKYKTTQSSWRINVQGILWGKCGHQNVNTKFLEGTEHKNVCTDFNSIHMGLVIEEAPVSTCVTTDKYSPHSKITVCHQMTNVILPKQIILKTDLQSEKNSVFELWHLPAVLLINAELLFPGYIIITTVY